MTALLCRKSAALLNFCRRAIARSTARRMRVLQRLRAQIQALSEKYGLEVSLDQKITELSVGAQQRVEILKALWRGAEILILDEPTAVLTDEETEGLFAIIRRLQQEGKGILFISHKLREVMAISDRILVLRRGEAVAEITDMTQANEQTLASTMVGNQVETCIYEKSTAQGRNKVAVSEGAAGSPPF